VHRRSLIISSFIVSGSSRTWAQDDFSEVIGTLSRERTLGEAGVSVMKRFAPEDLEGHLQYARTKAAFDELIDQLLADLAQGKDPNISPKFREKVQHAVDNRIAFSKRITKVIEDRVPPGAKAGWPDLLAAAGGAGDLIKQLVSSGILISQEWRTANNDRRKRLVTRIEAQRWKAFADIQAA
jgi:hypothetical protein